MARNNRSDAEYEIGGLSKGIKVLEALEGTAFEPVGIRTVIERTDLPRDIVTRALKTLRLLGYAIETPDKKWTIGKRFVRFAQRASKSREF